MAAASRAVLAGLELRSDAKVIRHPDRYADPRGARMWSIVMKLLSAIPNGRDLTVQLKRCQAQQETNICGSRVFRKRPSGDLMFFLLSNISINR